MARRTVNLTDSVEALVRAAAQEGESFSAAAARLIELGSRSTGRRQPRYVGSGEGPSVSTSGSSAQVTGADTVASGRARTE